MPRAPYPYDPNCPKCKSKYLRWVRHACDGGPIACKKHQIELDKKRKTGLTIEPRRHCQDRP